MNSWLPKEIIEKCLLKDPIQLQSDETIYSRKGEGVEIFYIIRYDNIIVLGERKL